MRAGMKKSVALMLAGLFCVTVLPAASQYTVNPEVSRLPRDALDAIPAGDHGDQEEVTVVQTLMRADGSRESHILHVSQTLIDDVMMGMDSGSVSGHQWEVLLGAGGVDHHTLQEWRAMVAGAEKGLPVEKRCSAAGNLTWVIRGPSLVLATGYGISLTRPVTFVKALLNQWFGRTFQIMPPFFTVIPEIDVMLNYDGALGTLSLLGGPEGLSPMYMAVFFGFVGLHWRLLSPPLQVFMGAAGGVIALGYPPENPDGQCLKAGA